VFHSKPSSADAVAYSCASALTLDDNTTASAAGQRNVKVVERGQPAQKRKVVHRRNEEPSEEQLVEGILQAFNTWSFKREQPVRFTGKSPFHSCSIGAKDRGSVSANLKSPA
jgi:hypothetical protein